LTLLLVGVISGAAGAHAVRRFATTGILGSGMFTVQAGEAVDFNVTLQADRGDAPARILLRLLDANGVTVVRRDVTLEPGRSATLRYGQPGTLRALAQIVEPDAPVGSQRLVLTTIEIFSSADPKSLDPGFDLTGRRRFVCSSDDGAGPGRIPDSD
jgi:hypothetical protein